MNAVKSCKVVPIESAKIVLISDQPEVTRIELDTMAMTVGTIYYQLFYRGKVLAVVFADNIRGLVLDDETRGHQIIVNGVPLPKFGFGAVIQSGTIIEICSGWVIVTTDSFEGRFLIGEIDSLEQLQLEADERPDGDTASAVAFWQSGVASPCVLTPLSEAVYERIVASTQRQCMADPVRI